MGEYENIPKLNSVEIQRTARYLIECSYFGHLHEETDASFLIAQSTKYITEGHKLFFRVRMTNFGHHF